MSPLIMAAIQEIAPAGPHTASFWRAFAIHMRPYLLFVSGVTGIAGLSYTADFSPGMGLLLGAAFFLSYGFGQALTDCFQTDTDSISSPYRPLVQGTIRNRDVRVVSLVGLIALGITADANAFFNAPSAALRRTPRETAPQR